MASVSLKGRTKNIANRSKHHLESALYVWLFREGGDEVSVRHQLNEFLSSRKKVYKWEVGDTIKKLRQRKHYFAALKLSDTMARRGMNMTISDQAIHLDLIAKTHGISAAENYFIDLPESSKGIECYGSLLNSYCKELISDKAEALMEKMKELGLPITAMSYNSLMSMYTKVGQPEKVPALAQEMKSADIMLQVCTYNIWMRALAAEKDIYGVERVLDEMKRDGRVVEDWTTYSNLASIYLDAGMSDKADNALKELEKRNTSNDLSPYNFLITLYGRTGNLQEVYRVWRSLRLKFPKIPNVACLNMIHVLITLNDMPGAEKCFKEWESDCINYDIRIVNTLIEAYIKDDFKKAKDLKERARSKGAKPNAKTWEIFLDYHLKKGEVKPAVKCVENAISTGRGNGTKWVPHAEVISTIMQLFEQNKDVDGAEGFVELLKEEALDNLGPEVFEPLIRTYAAAGRTSPPLSRRLKMENVEVNEECKKLLGVVTAE